MYFFLKMREVCWWCAPLTIQKEVEIFGAVKISNNKTI